MPREWPLVGRTHELELVGQVLDRPDAVGVVIAGAAGVGKTRLARALVERCAAAGRSTVWAQATLAASPIPFGAFAHLLPGELGGTGPVNVLRVAGDAITARSVDGQLVVGVDDAHLLDASSAALLGHLARSRSCVVVATVRSREPVPDTIVSLWKDGPLERIELQTLSEHDVAELLRTVLGRVDASTQHRLWRASQGNPLYLRELLMGGVDTGALTQTHDIWSWRNPSLATPRMTELVESRIGDVTEAERAVLEVVAEAEPLEAAFLLAVSARSDVESLERRGLLETVASDRRRAVRLAHPLYTEAIRAATPASVVPAVRHRLAEALAATGARRAGDMLRLASWRLGAGDLADSALFVNAGRHAAGLLDFALAERLARAALDGGDDFEARLVLASALVGLSRFDEAETLFADLEARAENDDQRARAALRRSDNLHGPLGRVGEALDVCRVRWTTW